MSGPRRSAAAWLACAGCVLAGCYASVEPADGSVRDAGTADGDGAPPFDGDAGMCDWLGSTRLCGSYCGLRCPEEVRACSPHYHICSYNGPDFEPRGEENCSVHLRFGRPHCYSGRLCVTYREPEPDGIGGVSWGGACVSDEYCHFIQTEPGFEDVTCRYTDGHVFEDGPPDDECAGGALPADPFCGGRCGDTCPANPYADLFGGPPSCVGRSETRGFGVCVQGSWESRCWIGQEFRAETFADCGANLAAVGDPSGHPCVCMILSPVLMEEYADYGWAVAEQTCLAYQARYPEQVRCIPQSEL